MGSCDAKAAVIAVDVFSVLVLRCCTKLYSDKVRVAATGQFIGRSV